MSLLGNISNFFRAFDIVKALFALTFILVGVTIVYPDIFNTLTKIETFYKSVLCISAGVAGVYLVYHALDTRNKILTMNELIAGGVGFLLIAFAVYVFFGQTLNYYIQNTVKWIMQLMPYIIASSAIILGIAITNRNPKTKAGYILAIFGVVCAVIFFMLQEGLLDIIKKYLGM